MPEMKERIARAIRLSGGVGAGWAESDIERYVEQYAEVDMEAAAAVLTAIEAAGMVIVPREPTEEMIQAAKNAALYLDSCEYDATEPAGIWRTMIDAATPTPDREDGR